MEYNNIDFTLEEQKKLIENRNEIVKWVKENIIPYMKGTPVVKCDFGKTHTSPYTYEKTEEFHSWVYAKLKSFREFGGTDSEGFIGFGEKFGYAENNFENETSPSKLYSVVTNWKLIKGELLSEVKNMQRVKEEIYKFTV